MENLKEEIKKSEQTFNNLKQENAFLIEENEKLENLKKDLKITINTINKENKELEQNNIINDDYTIEKNKELKQQIINLEVENNFLKEEIKKLNKEIKNLEAMLSISQKINQNLKEIEQLNQLKLNN